MSFAILTNTGRNKEARALADGAGMVITEMAWGDGDRVPSGGEVSLQNEQGRKPLTSNGISPEALNTAWFEVFLTEEEGPFVIHEVGLFDEDGDMVAIAKYEPAVNKPLNTVSAVLRINVVFSDLENVVVKIDPSLAYVTTSRTVSAGRGLRGGGDLSENIVFEIDHQEVLRPSTQKWVLTSDWQEETNAANGTEQIAIGLELEASIRDNHSDAVGVIVTGDITDEGAYTDADLAAFAVPPTTHKGQRRRFNTLMRGSVGVVALLGNHDWSYVPPEIDPVEGYSNASFLRNFPATRYLIQIGTLTIVMISDEQKGTSGVVSDDTVEWWDDVVQGTQNQSFVLCASHQIMPNTIDPDDDWANRHIVDGHRFTDRMEREHRPTKPHAWLCGHQGSSATTNTGDRHAKAFGVDWFQIGAHIPSIAGDVPARPAVYWTMELVEESTDVVFKQWGVLGGETTLHGQYIVQSPVPMELSLTPHFDGRYQRHNRFDTEVSNLVAATAKENLSNIKQEIRLRVLEGKRTANMENGL